jgi:hypothetical protein
MRLALLFFLLTLCGSGWTQQLWQDARAGMSPEQVIAAIPGAVLRSDAPVNKDGGVNSVASRVEIADSQFDVSFTFKASKLSEVRLTSKPSTPSETERVGKAVLEALRAKYGREVSAERLSIGTQHGWIVSGTKITLDVIQIGSASGLVNVFYGVAIDGGKL